MGVEGYDFGFPQGFRIFELERFDLMKAFEWDNKARKCRTYNIPSGDTFPPVWGWLANAQYVGQRVFRNFALDFWNYTTTIRGVTVQQGVGVLDTGATAPTRPIVFGRHWSINGIEQRRETEFIEWATQTPDPKLFNIPRDCNASPSKLLSLRPIMPAIW
jgi:hypothetical protein